jgi:hypothetical protein
MPVATLLDIAKKNGSDPVVGLIDETTKAHPEITRVAARTIKGLNYKTWVRTGLPVTGFRNANEGGIVDHSKWENRLVDTFLFNPRIEVDKAVADADEDGANAFLSYEMEGTVESTFQVLGKQFYYGRANDAKGHPGLIDSVKATYVYDAGGTTANTGTSVWGIKTGEKLVQWVWGANGQFTPSDIMIQRVTDAGGKPYTAYIQEILARPGLQVGNLRGVGRIKNITSDAGHTLTDAKIESWLSQFEVGWMPDVVFMNRRARAQLQNSRTVTLFGQAGGKFTGKEGNVAPLPVTTASGIPIEVTDSISDTEALS